MFTDFTETNFRIYLDYTFGQIFKKMLFKSAI